MWQVERPWFPQGTPRSIHWLTWVDLSRFLAIVADQNQWSHSDFEYDNTTAPLTDPWCADTARANLGSCTRGGLAVTSLFLCSTFSFLRCLNIHAWHSPRLELWSCSPCCFLINNEPHMSSYCSHLCCPFCLILYWLIGARQLKWKVAECSPRCSSAFEVLVVVVCRSQPRGYDWHRFYVSSLSFSDKVGLCASCDGCVRSAPCLLRA